MTLSGGLGLSDAVERGPVARIPLFEGCVAWLWRSIDDAPAESTLVRGVRTDVVFAQDAVHLAPSPGWYSTIIERDSVWNQRRELLGLIRAEHPQIDGIAPNPRCALILRLVTVLNQMVLHDASVSDVLSAYVVNSHKTDVLTLRALLDSDDALPEEGFPTNDTHIPSAQFGWIYARQIGLIRAATPPQGGPVTVVDVGAGAGYFSHAVSAVLQEPTVRFLNIDRNIRDNSLLSALTSTGPHQVDSVEADVTSDPFEGVVQTAIPWGRADVLVANHLLEHLRDAQPVHWITRWLRIASVVSVSVPLWDRLETTVSDHHEVYTPERLRQIAEAVCDSHPGVRVDTGDLRAGMLTFFHE